MHLSPLVRLSSSPLWLLATVVVLTALLWLIFVRLLPLNDITWKRVDYLWLSIALLGVLASSRRASHEFAKAEIGFLEPVTNFSFQTLRHDIEFGASPGSEGCAPRIRTSFSPPDYEEIRKAQQHLCEQFRKLDSEVPKAPVVAETKFAALDELKFQPLSENEQSVKYERDQIERLKADAAQYDKDRQAYNIKLREERDYEDSPLVMMDLGIGPLLVGLAVAIRLTKTAGEIRNKRVGEKPADSKPPEAQPEAKASAPTAGPPTSAPPEPKVEAKTPASLIAQPTTTPREPKGDTKKPDSPGSGASK
jgi:hypothetical protein